MGSSNTVWLLFFTSLNPKNAMDIAPIITKIRLGSHRPVMSKKPMTLAGLVMPEIIKPSPKIRPESNVRMFFII